KHSIRCETLSPPRRLPPLEPPCSSAASTTPPTSPPPSRPRLPATTSRALDAPCVIPNLSRLSRSAAGCPLGDVVLSDHLTSNPGLGTMSSNAIRHLNIDPTFSLAETCGPVAWARGRWPNVDWLDGALVWVGWENDRAVHRIVRQHRDRPS